MVVPYNTRLFSWEPLPLDRLLYGTQCSFARTDSTIRCGTCASCVYCRSSGRPSYRPYSGEPGAWGRIRAGKGLVEQTVVLEVADKLGRVPQKEVKTMQPAPGLAKIYTSTIGSSGGIMSLFSLLAVALPSKKIGVLSVRVVWGGLVAFDVLGAMGKLPTEGIAHGGHLAGDVIGILCYILWLRRTPPSKMLGFARRHWV